MKMPVQMWNDVGPRKHLLDEGAHWRYLANIIDRDVRKSLTSSLKSLGASLKSSRKSFTSSPKSLRILSFLPCLGRSFTNYVTRICVIWTHLPT